MPTVGPRSASCWRAWRRAASRSGARCWSAWWPRTTRRFAFNDDRSRIRASQGHSIAVDLQLREAEPPAVLYHGTASRFLKAILASGLRAGARHHVHLSADRQTAMRVGARHGFPAVLIVDAARMRADGIVFYQSDNGVWLTAEVKPKYLAQTAPTRHA